MNLLSPVEKTLVRAHHEITAYTVTGELFYLMVYGCPIAVIPVSSLRGCFQTCSDRLKRTAVVYDPRPVLEAVFLQIRVNLITYALKVDTGFGDLYASQKLVKVPELHSANEEASSSKFPTCVLYLSVCALFS